ncbi:MAG: YcjF family protein [Paracoccaceae bacterium]
MSKKLPAFQYSPKTLNTADTNKTEVTPRGSFENSGCSDQDNNTATNETTPSNNRIENSHNMRRVEAEELTKLYAGWAGAAGGIPIPTIDAIVVTGIQIKLLSALAKIYNVDFSKHRLKSILGSILGAGTPIVIGGVAQTALPVAFGSISKAALGFGTIIGAVAVGTASYASTLLIGKIFMEALESGKELSVSQLKEMSSRYLKEKNEQQERL